MKELNKASMNLQNSKKGKKISTINQSINQSINQNTCVYRHLSRTNQRCKDVLGLTILQKNKNIKK